MSSLASSEWQPIETAPANEMLLVANTGWGALDRVIACKREYAESGWVDQYGKPLPPSWAPGWWMRLPASPVWPNEREPARP